MELTKKRASVQIGKRKKLIFYTLMMALPLIQFIIFWIAVNINSILLAFKVWDFDKNAYVWNGFEAFKNEIELFRTEEFIVASVKNSLIVYLFGLFLGTPLALIFSFYLYKKKILSGLFKTVLFLPHILSALIMVLLYKYMLDIAIPEVYKMITGIEMQGLIANDETRFASILFYNIWTGFGTSTMMYLGAMSGISDSVVEAAELDGITPPKELWHITIPLIWPTFTTFVVVGFVGLFTGQMNLYNFYGEETPYELYTFGYYLYIEAKKASSLPQNIPDLAALGLIFTAVAAPCTLLLRKMLDKFGPKTI